MAQTSTYSYTERKRIRKSFGSRDSLLEIPYLLQMQKDAYTAFLQAEVALLFLTFAVAAPASWADRTKV